MRERKESGLCYNCDEKCTPGHRCKSLKLFLLDGAQIKDHESEPEEAGEGIGDSQEFQFKDLSEISLQSIFGVLAPQTMRIKGLLGGNL